MMVFKKIQNCQFHLRFALNPYIRCKSDHIGDRYGITYDKRSVPIIVSLTSFPERFEDLELSIYSLLTQSLKPDKIILWFTDEYDLANMPYSVTKYLKNGLEIRFVKDIGSYTKIIYALKEFSDSIIVTADDDVIYPKDWLEKLYHSYISHPEDIHVHRAHRVLTNNGEIIPYEKWEKHINEETARFDNFLTGVGGVLYPPKCFTSEVLREDIFLKYAPTADDVWLWTMALVAGRKVRVVLNHYSSLTCTNILRNMNILSGKFLYKENAIGNNDKQLHNLLQFYRQNILSHVELEYYND